MVPPEISGVYGKWGSSYTEDIRDENKNDGIYSEAI